MVTFGDRMREARKYANLTLEDLAEKLETTKATLSRYENNKRFPDIYVLKKLSSVLNVDTDYLLGNSEIKNNNKSEQEKYIDSLKLDSAEDAIKFILQQPSIMEFGGYNLNEMSEEEIMDLANDLLFAMKLSLEKSKKK